VERDRGKVQRGKKTSDVKKPPIKTSSAKSKGRSLQQWACDKISILLNIPWGKDALIASREMGQSGVDVRLIGSAQERFPYSVECKYQETWALPAWIKQAKANQKEGTDWLLILRKNRMSPVVIMDGAVFFEILKRLEKDD